MLIAESVHHEERSRRTLAKRSARYIIRGQFHTTVCPPRCEANYDETKYVSFYISSGKSNQRRFFIVFTLFGTI